jgi:hypothetical protein
MLSAENTYVPAQMHIVQNPDAMKFVTHYCFVKSLFQLQDSR